MLVAPLDSDRDDRAGGGKVKQTNDTGMNKSLGKAVAVMKCSTSQEMEAADVAGSSGYRKLRPTAL